MGARAVSIWLDSRQRKCQPQSQSPSSGKMASATTSMSRTTLFPRCSTADLAKTSESDNAWRNPSEYRVESVDVHPCKSVGCPCCHKGHAQPLFIDAPKGISPTRLRLMPNKWWAAERTYDKNYLLLAIEEAVAALQVFFESPKDGTRVRGKTNK